MISAVSSRQDVGVLSGAHPIFGHLPQIREGKLAFVQKIARETPYAAWIKTPFANVLAINDIGLVHDVLVEKHRSFIKSPIIKFALAPLAADGLFTSEGELWRRQRKLMAPLFQPHALGAYVPDMAACTDRLLATWRGKDRIEVAHEMTNLTMSIAGKTLFDADTFSEADEIGEALTVALGWSNVHSPSLFAIGHILGQRVARNLREQFNADRDGLLRRIELRLQAPLTFPGRDGRQLEDAIRVLDTYVQQMIDDRRTRPGAKNDLLAKLLFAHDAEEGQMSDRQLRDEILTLFVAGHETTANGLAWTIQLLCQHPEIYAEVEKEASALAGRSATKDDVGRFPLARKCFQEALRLYPPVYIFGRKSEEAVRVGSIDVARDTVVVISPYALHRKPDLWPYPERFDPHRFDASEEAKRHRLAWLPFGAGPRVCIGNHFALIEAELVLATLLSRVRFRMEAPEVPAPTVTLRPAGPMPMGLSWK